MATLITQVSTTSKGFKILLISILISITTIAGIMYMGMVYGALIIMLPFLIWLVASIFSRPLVGLMVLFIVNYFIMGITRYIPGPLGLSIDILLITTFISVLIHSAFKKGLLSRCNRDLTWLALIWFVYAIFQFFNPEAVSRIAWFFAMRGFSLYFLLTVALTFILFHRKSHLDTLIMLLSIFTLLGVMKGIWQEAGNLDYAELHWLAAGGSKTHIIGGRLRIFSFFTDAGQYGASMAYSGVLFAIISIGTDHRAKKYYYMFVSLMAFVGMMISGTRGAIAVPAAALVTFMIISGNRKHMILTALFILSVFMFFKHTNIGNSNYQISRMRTAFNGNDASFQVRLDNQAKLSTYLASRPFGGGIGSAGNWGQRFSPNTFLAQTPTDSWYVSIWAEQGVVGLFLHLFILGYILIKGIVLIKRVQDRDLSFKLKGLICGLAGIMLASYGNGVMGQMPTGIILYMSMAFIFMAKELDQQERENNNKSKPEVSKDSFGSNFDSIVIHQRTLPNNNIDFSDKKL